MYCISQLICPLGSDGGGHRDVAASAAGSAKFTALTRELEGIMNADDELDQFDTNLATLMEKTGFADPGASEANSESPISEQAAEIKNQMAGARLSSKWESKFRRFLASSGQSSAYADLGGKFGFQREFKQKWLQQQFEMETQKMVYTEVAHI